MKIAIPRMTLAELHRIPDDFNRYELIDGELYVTPAPRTRHQTVSTRFTEVISHFATRRKLGRVYYAPTDVYLEPSTQTCVQPDILFIPQARLDMIKDKGIFGPPDLVLEISSESSYWTDRIEKRDLYRRAGVQEYWIVDPDENYVLLYRFAEFDEPKKLTTGDMLTTPLLPGLHIRLRSIFAK